MLTTKSTAFEKTTEAAEQFQVNENSRRQPSTVGGRSRRGAINPLLPVIAGVMALAAVGVVPRMQNADELGRIHEQLAASVPSVRATVVTAGRKEGTLTLPGDLQPIQDIPIYARVNGYLSQRLVDIGDHVKAGQVLAIVDTPELDQQVQQAMSNLRAAEANLASAYSDKENFSAQLFAADATIKQNRTNLEFSTSEIGRYQELVAEGAISYEERDRALKNYNADTAQVEVAKHTRRAQLAQLASANARIAAAKQSVEAAEANLKSLQATQGFQKVVAPADGVITNRLADAGALVAAGGSSGTTQILSMAKTDALRIYVDVPQSDYRYIHNNDKAVLTLQEFPGRTFTGTVTNIAGSLNSKSRTLQTEIRIDNKDHVLKPGSYAEVSFHYFNPNPPAIIPSSAAITRNDGLYAAVVSNGKIAYRSIQVARDYGNKMEVSQGLHAGDVVAIDAPDGLAAGSQVAAKVSDVF